MKVVQLKNYLSDITFSDITWLIRFYSACLFQNDICFTHMYLFPHVENTK